MSSKADLLDIPPRAADAHAAQSGVFPLILLSLGHLTVDTYSGALGALQPLLVQKFSLSLAQAGLLGGLLVFSSSVMQPVYGFLSDRFHTRMFTVLAPLVTAFSICGLGAAPAYGWLMAAVWMAGVGIASFHPQASAWAGLGLGARPGRAMALFISAGSLGYALGPTYFSLITNWAGLSRLYWASIPGVLVTLFLFAVLPAAPRRASHGGAAFDWKPLAKVWKPLLILYALVYIRSILQVTFAQLLPLYLHLEKGFSLAGANSTLTMYLASGALGGFIGGHLADRFGGRTVILASMLGSVPFLALFFFASGWVSLAGLAAGGFILLFTIPVNVVMAQELVPSQAGTVSALTMGFAWGMAGLVFIPIAGWASDLFSMHHVLSSLLVFPVIGFFLALKLKK